MTTHYVTGTRSQVESSPRQAGTLPSQIRRANGDSRSHIAKMGDRSSNPSGIRPESLGGATRRDSRSKIAFRPGKGTAIAGDYGFATAGKHGTAIAGKAGTAIAGDFGKAIAGAGGTAIVGYHGSASASWGGTLIFKVPVFGVPDRHSEVVVCYVGINIDPDMLYTVRDGRVVVNRTPENMTADPFSHKNNKPNRN